MSGILRFCFCGGILLKTICVHIIQYRMSGFFYKLAAYYFIALGKLKDIS